MIRKSSWWWHAGALALYAALAVGFIDHGVSITKNVLGIYSDPFAFIWFLSWWPWALAHHVDPFFSHIIWQPEGVDLAWMTSVPALALLAMPITLSAGPVLAYNILIILAPVLAALSAYALCLYLTKKPVPALLGGLCYGFSSYEMAESLSHLNLDFNAAVPCLLLVVLARLDNRLSRPMAALLFGILLAVQFYISIEVAATALLFGGLAWVLALSLLSYHRRVLSRLFVDGLLAGLVSLALILPVLWNMATKPRSIEIPLGWAYMTAAHLFNLMVTTPAIVFVSPAMSYADTSILFHLPQYDFSTGLLLLLIIGFYIYKNVTLPKARFLLYMLITILVASLGPQLWIGGHFSNIIMPWYFALRIPLLNSALPVRFALYSSLIIAIIMALWIAQAGTPKRLWLRAGVATLAWGLTVMPPHPVKPAPYSAFFRPGRLEAVLGKQARVLILHGQNNDDSSFWQAENHFGFVQTQGYLGRPPKAMLAYAGVRDLTFRHDPPQLVAEIKQLCLATNTQFVVAGPGTASAMIQTMDELSWPSSKVDDVLIFTVPTHG
jgi:hypothetical protein